MSWLFDTNIIIDFLNSVPQARSIFTPETERAISIMSWIEVMTGATAETEPAIRSVLSTCKVVPLTPEIAERAVILRRQTRLKLPDAIILATAQQQARTLVTRNTRDFSATDPKIFVPYEL